MNNILSNEFESLKADLIKAYDAKGMRASGNFANELEVIQPTTTRVQLWGADYAQQLETGRDRNNGNSGKKWENPIEDIKQWIQDKGIANRLNGEITVSQLAFLIARKIARQGWKREGYGGVELISEVVTDKRMQKIIDEVGLQKVSQVQTEIIKLIKTL